MKTNMMQSLKTHIDDHTTQAGLVILILTSSIFLLADYLGEHSITTIEGSFLFNYILTVFYFILVLIRNKKSFGKYFRFRNLTHNILLLQIFNISAYALNRSIPVFDISVGWLQAFLIFTNIVIILHLFLKESWPKKWSIPVVFILNIALIFHIYQTIYVGKYMVYGVAAFWFLGIPLHAFVPVLYVWAIIKCLRYYFQKDQRYWTATLMSWCSVIILLAFCSYRFHDIQSSINKVTQSKLEPYQENSLPDWVQLSQSLTSDWFTKRALQVDMQYRSGRDLINSGFSGFDFLNRTMHHDPLIVVASLFASSKHLGSSSRIKILNTLYDQRHQNEPKLWRGDKLITSGIHTNVQLFPQYRLAYTEKTIRIQAKPSDFLRRQQEALYTFYLPEGSVVTSASLWIEGEERPAYLTTKSKATEAYNTIVGRERRDPLLLHWQEGNRVTVRVFPCTTSEERQFKIGVTSPLKKTENRLIYQNIDFKGPNWQFADEDIHIVTEGLLQHTSSPYSFRQDGNNYVYKGKYKSKWRFEFDVIPLSSSPFIHNGQSYRLSDYEKENTDWSPEEMYLDINADWTRKEYNKIWESRKANQKIFAFVNHRITEITAQNKNSIFKNLKQLNFSIFPYYKISNPENALVICTSNEASPTLSELKGSPFKNKLSTYFAQHNHPLRVYHLSSDQGPFIKSLQDYLYITVESGTIKTLLEYLSKDHYPSSRSQPHTTSNQYACFNIHQESADLGIRKSEAPDHLKRLYTYKDIMRAIGLDQRTKEDLSEAYIDQAKEAYVVTPISSLVTLETRADYDRFDIQKSKNSLKNASIGNSGAVPEPHEWALIILVLTIMTWLRIKR